MRNVANFILLSGVIVSCSSPEIEFYQDFDGLAAGTVLTENQIRDVFSMKSTAHVTNNGVPGVMVVADPANSGRDKVFQLSFLEGSVQKNGGGGAQWVTRITAADEYYFAYDMYVPADFNWPLSSKLPGLFGGDISKASASNVPDGITAFALRQGVVSERKEGDTTGWSNIGDGNLGANPHTFGNIGHARYNYALVNTRDENSARLIPGYWARIEQHVRLNDPGIKNGVYEAWLDGVKVFSASNYEYRTVDSLKIDGISFVWFYGGSGDSFAAREDQAYYFDNFVVSTQPISH